MQEGLKILLKKANAIIRRSTFNIDFAEHVIEDYFDIIKGLWKGKALVCISRLKRAGILANEETFYKKLIPKCLIYRLKGHSLWDCWCLFKNKRPTGVIIGDIYIKRALKKVE